MIYFYPKYELVKHTGSIIGNRVSLKQAQGLCWVSILLGCCKHQKLGNQNPAGLQRNQFSAEGFQNYKQKGS